MSLSKKVKYLVAFLLLINLNASVANAFDDNLCLETNDKFKDNQVEIWEDGMRTSEKNDSFEWWYFDGISNQGVKLVIIFNAGNVTKQPSIFVNITFPNGESFTKNYSFPEDEFQASNRMCDVTIGKNRFSGDLENYQIYLDLEDIKSEINLERVTPSWKPKNNLISKKEQFGYLHAVPHGNMEGYLTYQGKRYKLEGTGYHDHTWSTISENRLSHYMKEWYWGRALFDDYAVIFGEGIASLEFLQGNIKKILYVAKGSNLIINDEVDVKIFKKNYALNPFTKKLVPNIIEIRYSKDGIKLNITLHKQLGMVSFGSSDDTSYHRHAGMGVFEIETDGNKSKHHGTSIWEIKDLSKSSYDSREVF